MISDIFAALVVGSGVILGAILAVIAKEELKSGMKYFLLLKNIVYLLVMLTVSIYYFDINFAFLLRRWIRNSVRE